jgi:tetratricopeptide (TPR) repeat protein
MPRPLQSPPAPSQELRHFTNREKERDVLRRALALPRGQPLPVLMFFGVGGAGKSWLLRKLREDLPPHVPSALLDLEPRSGGTPFHTDSSRSLAYLRGQFPGVACPRFDLAYAWLRYKEGIKDEPLFKGGGVVGAAVEAIGEVASGALDGVPFVGMLVKKLAGKLRKTAEGTRLERWLAEQTGQQDFLRLRGMAAQEIYPELARRLLTDLAEGLPEREGYACRGVAFLDTVEKLRVGTPGDAQGHEREAWVRELVAPDSPLLLVLAGRDGLRWAEIDREFAAPEVLEQHLVGGLSEPDARQFLSKCGVVEQQLQDAVLRASVDTETDPGEEETRGSHPFSLGLAADAIVTEQARGQAVTASTFDIRPGDYARLAQQFLKSLADPAHEVWVRRLALTPRFDEAAARAAHSESRGVVQDAAWQALLRYSFVRGADERGFYTLHAKMRDALAETAAATADDHAFWEQHWRRRSESDSDGWAGLAWFHRYRLDPQAAWREWKTLAEAMRESRKMADHYQLLRWWDVTDVVEGRDLSPGTAVMLDSLACELTAATLGRRSENVQQAIACYSLILRVYTEADFPRHWAATQTNLGTAYQELPTGDRAANLRKAIDCFTAALRVRTEADLPQDWAATQNNLGMAYDSLPTGDRAENLRRAIACYTAALRVCTEADSPRDWAMTQHNLGGAYAGLPTGDRAANVRRAIACYTAALRVYTEADSPRDWATTQVDLGCAYGGLPTGDRGANLRTAIACFTAALRVRTEADLPQWWAVTQNGLGAAYWGLPTGDRGANLRTAIDCYTAALRVYTEADFPQWWAMTQNNLGLAYRDVFRLTGDFGSGTLAVASFTAAERGYRARHMEQEADRAHQLAEEMRAELNSRKDTTSAGGNKATEGGPPD